MSAHTVEAETAPAFDTVAVGRMAQSVGQQTHGPFDVPAGASSVIIILDRTDASFQALPSNTRCAQVMVEMSYDNGATWGLLSGFTTNGGTFGSSTVSYTQTTVPQSENIMRKIRIVLTMDASYTTACQIRWV